MRYPSCVAQHDPTALHLTQTSSAPSHPESRIPQSRESQADTAFKEGWKQSKLLPGIQTSPCRNRSRISGMLSVLMPKSREEPKKKNVAAGVGGGRKGLGPPSAALPTSTQQPAVQLIVPLEMPLMQTVGLGKGRGQSIIAAQVGEGKPRAPGPQVGERKDLAGPRFSPPTPSKNTCSPAKHG